MGNNLKYWQLELPKIEIMGKIRIAHYAKSGVVQLSLLHQENDGQVKIGKTICLYRDSLYRNNLKSIDFLMDILHSWRKEARQKYPIVQPEIITLPSPVAVDTAKDAVTLENVEEQGDLHIADAATMEIIAAEADQNNKRSEGK